MLNFLVGFLSIRKDQLQMKGTWSGVNLTLLTEPSGRLYVDLHRQPLLTRFNLYLLNPFYLSDEFVNINFSCSRGQGLKLVNVTVKSHYKQRSQQRICQAALEYNEETPQRLGLDASPDCGFSLLVQDLQDNQMSFQYFIFVGLVFLIQLIRLISLKAMSHPQNKLIGRILIFSLVFIYIDSIFEFVFEIIALEQSKLSVIFVLFLASMITYLCNFAKLICEIIVQQEQTSDITFLLILISSIFSDIAVFSFKEGLVIFPIFTLLPVIIQNYFRTPSLNIPFSLGLVGSKVILLSYVFCLQKNIFLNEKKHGQVYRLWITYLLMLSILLAQFIQKCNRYYFKSLNSGNQGDQCSICLNESQVESKSSTICNHVFHKRCLQEWLQKRHVCPVCRRQLTPLD